MFVTPQDGCDIVNKMYMHILSYHLVTGLICRQISLVFVIQESALVFIQNKPQNIITMSQVYGHPSYYEISICKIYGLMKK